MSTTEIEIKVERVDEAMARRAYDEGVVVFLAPESEADKRPLENAAMILSPAWAATPFDSIVKMWRKCWKPAEPAFFVKAKPERSV